MARVANWTTSKTGDHPGAHAGRGAGSALTHSFAAHAGSVTASQLGRDILVEVLFAAARVLTESCASIRPVDSANPARVPSAGDVASAAPQVGTKTSRTVDEQAEVISPAGGLAHPAAGPLPLVRNGKGGSEYRPKAALGVHLYRLRRTSCRWPLGPFLAHTERFCGAPSVPGCPYCPEHRERAFVRPGIRRAHNGPGTHEPMAERSPDPTLLSRSTAKRTRPAAVVVRAQPDQY
jgi:hypothetical protein